MSNDPSITVFGGDAFGREITNGRPENHLADVDSHMTATAERVKHARLYWRERDPSEFVAYGSTGRRVVDRTSGEQYVHVTHDPFQSERPQDDTISCFVQNGGWIFYLEPRGVERAPGGEGLSAAVVGGEIQQGWDGKPVLVDDAGNTVTTRLTKGGARR